MPATTGPHVAAAAAAKHLPLGLFGAPPAAAAAAAVVTVAMPRRVLLQQDRFGSVSTTRRSLFIVVGRLMQQMAQARADLFADDLFDAPDPF